MEFEIKEGSYVSMGPVKQKNGYVFTFMASENVDCEILLYEKNKYEPVITIQVPEEWHIGDVRSVLVEKLDGRRFDYNYKIDGQVVTDPYAKGICGREKWYDLSREQNNFLVKGKLDAQVMMNRPDRSVWISPENMIMYKLHVRGFTMDTSFKNKGTFQAITRKIPYLKDLGITSVEIMPVYEFEEVMMEKEDDLPDYIKWKKKKSEEDKKEQESFAGVNFWGYERGNYFAPKASYAATENAALELKKLIEKLHENNMECILEMYFPDEVDELEIFEVLHFWVLQYHVDGFHLVGRTISSSMLTEDPYLKRTKLFCAWFPDEVVNKEENATQLYFYNDAYLYPIRKMLSGKDPDLYEFICQMRRQKDKASYVNYLADNNGFSLIDVFSYVEKHNEENGEKNLDGSNWNYSCNCGIEGPTKKSFVLNTRRKMMYDAFSALFMAQGIPLVFSGDEFGNSQNGNNNVYCQDNKTGWVNWKDKEKNKKIYLFVKELIRFRKEHPVISRTEPVKLCDYKGVGIPDISYHGQEAWLSAIEPERLSAGILYAGKYALLDDGNYDRNIYVAFNFHLSEKVLALPIEDKDEKWYRIFDTARDNGPLLEEVEEPETMQIKIKAQSACIFVAK